MESATIQIVTSDANTITLNEALRRILTKDEIKDRYVSVISISGAFRQGKSFLLNFLLRYLQIKHIEKRVVSEWLRPEDGPLKGFAWASGSRRHTIGIHMLPEIYLTQLPTGEKVAVILLDTQGQFDNDTTMSDSAKIFALSTLISSVQIYNLMRNIKQYDLGHLQYFGSYGKLFTSSNGAPFQNLCFLIRDWPFADEHGYGEKGGSDYLKQEMESNNPEIRKQIETVQSLFDKISCFLLPYPGSAVATSNSFDGDLNDVDDDFKKHVQDFVPMLLSPENLILKTVCGERVTAGSLMVYIQEYCNVLKEGDLPLVENIFSERERRLKADLEKLKRKATVEAHHQHAMTQAFDLYKKNMNDEMNCKAGQLHYVHLSNLLKSISHFEKSKKIEDKDVYDKYLLDLKDKIKEHYEDFKKKYEARQAALKTHYETGLNQAFNLYKKCMNDDMRSKNVYSDPYKLNVRHQSNGEKAIAHFELKKIGRTDVYDKCLSELKNQIEEEFQVLKRINGERLEAEKKQLERIARQTSNTSAGTSNMSSLNPETIGTAVAVIGGIATLAFGISKIFSRSGGSQD